MSVATREIGDLLMRTGAALLQMSAEGGGTTQADVTQSLALLAGNHWSPALEELFLVSVQDIGYF